MQARLLKLVRCLNLPSKLCHHMLGKKHSTAHRMVTGLVVMVVGVVTAKFGPDFLNLHHDAFHVSLDLVGYGVHGLGLTPYLEYVLESVAEAA